MKRSSTFALRLFTFAFLILFTFAQPLLAIESLTPVNDGASVESIAQQDVEEDILDEGISDPEEIAKPISKWEVDGNTALTTEDVVLGEVYVAPQNSDVTVTFTKLPDISSTLSITEISLTDEEVKATGAVSDVAYDISTGMVDGTFEYDLTLPNSGDDSKVVYAENRSDLLSSVNEVSNVVDNGNLLEVNGLNHFTVFVVTTDTPALSDTSTPTCVEAGASTNSGCFNSIQVAINSSAPGDTIVIRNGIYNENIVINTSGLTILGETEANTILRGVSGVAITIAADNTTLGNFTVENTLGTQGITISGRSNILVSHMTIQNIAFGSGNVYGLTLVSGTLPMDNIVIENCTFSSIHQTGTSGSAGAIGVGWSNATQTLTGLIIRNNQISDVKASITNKGAYGIILNMGASGSAGQILSPVIQNNTITDLEGYWAHGLGLEGNISGVVITGNTITNIVDHKSPSDPDAVAIMIEDNHIASTLQVTGNTFDGVILGVRNATNVLIDARNNAWGTSKLATIQSMIRTSTPGTVLYDPWYGKTVTQSVTVDEYEKGGVYYVKKNGTLDFNVTGNPVYGQHYIVGLWGYNSSTGSRDNNRYIGWQTINPTGTGVDEDMTWNMVTDHWMGSSAPGAIIPAGDYLLWVERYYDEGGYVSGSTITKRVTVDDTRPVLSVVQPIQDDVFNGAVKIAITASDSQTDIGSVAMHIYNVTTDKLVPGCTSIPAIFDGTNWVATINDGGSCKLVEGKYRIAAWAYDSVGNPGWAARPEFNIDYTNPDGTLDGIFYSVGSKTYTINNFKTNSNSPMFTGTYSDNIGVASVQLSLAGFNVDAVLNSGTWQSPALGPITTDGTYALTITIKDLAGNTKTLTQDIVVDTKAPTASYTHFKDGMEVLEAQAFVQSVDQLSFTGSYKDADPSSGLYWDSFVIFDAQADGTFKFSQNGAKAYCSWRTTPNLLTLSGSTYNFTTPVEFSDCVSTLPEGTYYMAHHVYDSATRKDIPTINQFRDVLGLKFTVDTTPPASEFIGTDLSGTYHNSPITISGESYDPNGVVSVTLLSRPVGSSGDWTIIETINNPSANNTFAWSTTWEPAEGRYDIKAEATDQAGNTEHSPMMSNIIYDLTPPKIGTIDINIDYVGTYVNGRSGFLVSVPVNDSLSGINRNTCSYNINGMPYVGTYSNSTRNCYFFVPSNQLFDNTGVTISASISDKAGNPVTSDIVKRVVDKNLPISEAVIDDYYGPKSLPEIKGTASDTVSNITNVAFSLRRNSDGKYWIAGNIWMNISTPLHGTSGTDNWTYTRGLPTLKNNVTYTVTPYAWDQVHLATQAGISDSFIWDNELPQDPNSFRAYPDANIPTNDNIVEIYFSGESDNVSGVAGFYYSFSNTQETPDSTNWLAYDNHHAISEPLADGTWWFNIRTLDNAGNITSTNHYGPFIIDTTPATISWNAPLDESIHNDAVVLSATSNETMNNFRFLWKEAGDSSWTQGPNNNTHQTTYEYTFDPIEDGVYTLRAQGRDLAINWSKASPDIEITVDRTAPRTPDKLKFINPNLQCGSITNSYTVTAAWDDNGDNLTGVKEFIYSVDTPGVMGWTTRVSDTQRTGQFNQGEGMYTFMVKSVDNAGNESAWSNSCSVTYDATAPDVEITSPLNQYLAGSVEIRGSVTDVNPHHYWFVITNSTGTKVAGPGTVNDTSSFTDQLLLNWDTTSVPNGKYTIKLEARDSADNKDGGSVQWMTVTVDNETPGVSISTPSGLIRGTVDVIGSLTDLNPSTYTLEIKNTLTGDKVMLDVDQPTGEFTDKTLYTWDTTLLDDGEYDITFTGKDLAGNSTTIGVTEIIVDNTNPTATVLGTLTFITGDTTPRGINLADNHELDKVCYIIDSGTLQCVDVGGTGFFWDVSSLINTLGVGSHTFTYYVVDKAGNQSDSGVIEGENTNYLANITVNDVPVVAGAATTTLFAQAPVETEEETTTEDEDTTEDTQTSEEVKGVEDTDSNDEGEAKNTLPWWAYVLGGGVIVSFFLFLIWRRRKDKEEKNY